MRTGAVWLMLALLATNGIGVARCAENDARRL